MTEKLLKTKNWTPKEVAELLKELSKEYKPYTEEEKCTTVLQVAKELLKRGGSSNISSAENILIYATQHYFNSVLPQSKAGIYYCLGELYEKHKENFVRAYTYYEKYTLNNTEYSGNHAIMLKALILRDDFTYSDELEKEFRMSLGEGDSGRKNDRVYENLGRYIILTHEGNLDEAQKVIKRLWGIITNDDIWVLDIVTKKDLSDRVVVPEKVRVFIKEQFSEISK